MTQRNCGLVFHVSLLYNLVLEHEQRRPWWSHIEPRLILGALPLQDKDHLNLLVQREGVKAAVTMNQPEELLPNFLSTPVSPGTIMDTWQVKEMAWLISMFASVCFLCYCQAEWASEHVAQCFGSTEDFSSPALNTIEKLVLSKNVVLQSSRVLTLIAHRCVLFLHDQVDVQQNTTYVHCKAGRGRSAVVVVAFLVQYRQMTLDDAFEVVMTKRPHVRLNTSQHEILREFSKKYSSPDPSRPAVLTGNVSTHNW
uniref:Tyrosine specific protein phosphatases domain-containing protein n=1 Tax=Hyaloperonospora arabidopsidis (strain Emoy2) TaxID=559515 RepID=M4BI18_HYAAE